RLLADEAPILQLSESHGTLLSRVAAQQGDDFRVATYTAPLQIGHRVEQHRLEYLLVDFWGRRPHSAADGVIVAVFLLGKHVTEPVHQGRGVRPVRRVPNQRRFLAALLQEVEDRFEDPPAAGAALA